jgi:hypothetical protein
MRGNLPLSPFERGATANRPGIALRRATAFDVGPILAYHQHTRDGEYDSLCLRCFWTAAIGLSKSDLAEAEMKHVCGRVPALLAQPLTGRHRRDHRR